MSKRTLVLGIGSPIMCDDAIGLRVLNELSAKGLAGVDLVEACTSGLDLIEIMIGYDRVILIDAIINSGHPPGTILQLRPEDFSNTVHGTNVHEANIATTIELGKALAPDEFPQDILFVAVEANDVFTVTDHMTPALEAALPKVVQTVLDLINS